MAVKELRDALQQFPDDLPVCLADWNERYATPCEITALYFNTSDETYYEPTSGIDECYAPYVLLDIQEP